MHTSDVRHAGTDAQVYVNLYGNKGRSGKIVLAEGVKETDQFFERGSVDIFTPEVRVVTLHITLVSVCYNF